MLTRLLVALGLVLAVGSVPLDAKIHRSRAAVRRFERQTGFPHGRPGYVVDHIVPLCAGGADTPANMQWQTRADAAIKDRIERAQCAACRRHPSPSTCTWLPLSSAGRPSR